MASEQVGQKERKCQTKSCVQSNRRLCNAICLSAFIIFVILTILALLFISVPVQVFHISRPIIQHHNSVEQLFELKNNFLDANNVTTHDSESGAFFLNNETSCQNASVSLLLQSAAGHFDAVHLLLTDLNRRCLNVVFYRDQQSGMTALHAATIFDHFDVVRLLCESGDNNGSLISMRSHAGTDALMFAAYYGRSKIANYLVHQRKHVSITAANNYGYTALHLASATGHVDIVRLLCEKANDVAYLDARDRKGRTALMYSANRGYYQTVEYLLEQGAALRFTNEDGYTALDLAGLFPGVSECDRLKTIYILNVYDRIRHLLSEH